MASEPLIYHNSHDSFYRNPFGAVPCSADVVLRLRVDPELEVHSVVVRFWVNGSERRIEMGVVPSEDAGVYECAFIADSEPTIMWYWFEVATPGGLIFYCNNEAQRGGIGKVSRHALGSYQITVYDKSFHTPEWYKNSIMYQIFVDRFYSGGDIDPKGKLPPNGYLHQTWHEEPDFKPHPKHYGIRCDDFFGGNLAGIIDKLPYLKSLGVGVIYLNPIFMAPSNHKYDTSDYLKVDPMFGDENTFSQLCRQAHDLGIRIVLDGVFSHTGSDSVYFNREGRFPEVGAYQSEASPYYQWYSFKKHPDEYDSWWGIDTLPNVNEMDESYQEFIMGENGVARKWLRLGADGWRLDVADELPDSFIERLRRAIKAEKPDAVLIGEVWEDASNKVSYSNLRQFLWGRELDSPTNYPFKDALLPFVVGYIDADELASRLMSLCENYPKEAFYSTMNLLSSHDITRAITILADAPHEDNLSRAEQSRWRPSESMEHIARSRLMLASLIQMTSPGVPCIYYGDEVGLGGHRDPFCRRPFPWGHEDQILLHWYQRLGELRNRLQVLRTGNWLPFSVGPNVYGHVRSSEGAIAISVINRDVNNKVSVKLPMIPLPNIRLSDAMNGSLVEGSSSSLILDLEPLQGKLLISEVE